MDATKSEEPGMERFNDSLVLFLVSSSHGINHLAMFVYPVLLPAIMAEFNLNYVLAGLLLVAYQATSGAPQFVVSILQLHVRRKILLAVGTVWNALMTMCGSVAANFGQLFTTRVLAGTGASVQHPMGSSMLAEHFGGKRMGMAMGFNIAGATVGSLIAVPIATVLLQSFGWRTTLLLIGIPGLVMGMMLLFLKESRRTPSSPSGSPSFFKGLRGAYLTKPILVLTMVHCVIDFRFGALSFIPTYLVKKVGFDLQTSSGLYMLLPIGSTIGSILWGSISDRLGKKQVIIGALAVSAPMVYILPLLSSIYPLAILLLTLGLTFQTVSPLVQALVADFAKPEDIDRVFGIFYTIAFTLGLVGPLMFGYIADLFDFKAAFTYVAAVTLIAIIPAMLIPKRR